MTLPFPRAKSVPYDPNAVFSQNQAVARRLQPHEHAETRINDGAQASVVSGPITGNVNYGDLDQIERQMAIGTAAERDAARHWAANLRALANTQPRLASGITSVPAGVEWVYARDGSLTGRDAGGWVSDCSLPLRAATAMLQQLTVTGVVACFLSPVHGAQLRAALDKLDASQAIIALTPDRRELRIALGCFDFSEDIQRHRLWFAWGLDWETELTSLLADHPGLPTPSDFIRTPPVPDDVASRLIPAAERIISKALSDRTRQAQSLATPRPKRSSPARRLGVVAGSRFRLWNNPGTALARVFADTTAPSDWKRLDSDDPACASGLALALLASECDALVTCDLSRSCLSALIPASLPVITWLTTPAVPPFPAEASDDALLLADSAWLPAARAAGWPESRIAIAGWPPTWELPAFAPPGGLALIADTRALDTPTAELELSSHHLLWESIREELAHDPFQLTADIDAYLATRRAKLGISEAGFNRPFFVDRLLLPAYQQGLARKLRAAGLPLRVFGGAWDELPDFRDAWGGPVRSAQDLEAAVASASVLVYAWPTEHAHEIETLGKPVLRRNARRYDAVLREARSVIGSSQSPADGPVLSEAMIRKMQSAASR